VQASLGSAHSARRRKRQWPRGSRICDPLFVFRACKFGTVARGSDVREAARSVAAQGKCCSPNPWARTNVYGHAGHRNDRLAAPLPCKSQSMGRKRARSARRSKVRTHVTAALYIQPSINWFATDGYDGRHDGMISACDSVRCAIDWANGRGGTYFSTVLAVVSQIAGSMEWLGQRSFSQRVINPQFQVARPDEAWVVLSTSRRRRRRAWFGRTVVLYSR